MRQMPATPALAAQIGMVPQSRRNLLRLCAAAGLSAASLAMPAVAGEAAPIRIGGTGASLGGIKLLAEAFSRRRGAVPVSVVSGLGTQGSLRAVAGGALDLAVAARATNAEEQAAGLRSTLYATTPFGFATHRDTAVEAISLREIIAILGGTMTTWPNGTPIRVVRRPASDSDTHLIAAISPEMHEAVATSFRRPGLVTAATDHDNLEALEVVAGTFGTASLSHILTERRNVRLLTLDGHAPTVEAVAASRYPLVKSFYVTRRQALSPAAADFAAFMMSPEAATLLRGHGHLPVADATAARVG